MKLSIIALAVLVTASMAQAQTRATQQDCRDDLLRQDSPLSRVIPSFSFLFGPLGPFQLPLAPTIAANPPSSNGASTWPMFRANRNRRGYTGEAGPHSNPQQSSIATGNRVFSSPAGGHDETVYVGSEDYYLYSFTKDLSLNWTFKTESHPIYTSPAVSNEDGSIYVRSGNHLFKINEDGTQAWRYDTGTNGNETFSSPLVDDERDLIFFQWDTHVYAIDKNKKFKWKYNTGNQTDASPAVDDYSDGKVYAAAGTKLYAIRISNGSIAWTAELGQETWSSPVVICGGTPRVYVCTRYGIVYSFDMSGNKKWSYDTKEEIQSSPALRDKDLYVGTQSKLYNIYDNGTSCTVQWTYDTGGYVWSSPAVDAGGYVYVGTYSDKVIAVKDGGSTCSLAWSKTVNDDVYSSPAILYGRVYVGCCDGALYSFKP